MLNFSTFYVINKCKTKPKERRKINNNVLDFSQSICFSLFKNFCRIFVKFQFFPFFIVIFFLRILSFVTCLNQKAMATCSSCLLVLPNLRWSSHQRPNFKVRAQISGDNKKTTSVEPVNNGSVSVSTVPNQKGVNEVNGSVKSQKKLVSDEIELLWDDGYGSKSVKDYFAAAREILKPDGGPPRWFSPVDCGRPVEDAPTLLFLPGKQN